MLRRKLAVLLAAAAMLVAAASPAVAAPGNNGKGALKANPNAAFGIANAIVNSGSGSGCTFNCEPA